MVTFADRRDAGRQLGQALAALRGRDVVVLGLPRGGVPVAHEVANALHAPLAVIVVRKLGLPTQPELAMGAIGEDGVRVLNADIVRGSDVGLGVVDAVEAAERAELDLRVRRFRPHGARRSVLGKVAVIVDDGIATGATARAACAVARAHGAARVVLAAPIGAPRSVAELGDVADDVVCLETPRWFSAVGRGYRDFSQVSDDEVVELLTADGPEGPPGD